MTVTFRMFWTLMKSCLKGWGLNIKPTCSGAGIGYPTKILRDKSNYFSKRNNRSKHFLPLYNLRKVHPLPPKNLLFSRHSSNSGSLI